MADDNIEQLKRLEKYAYNIDILQLGIFLFDLFFRFLICMLHISHF